MSKLESAFQHEIIKELKELFVGCIVVKLDSGYIQGLPDILVLYNDRWAGLEVKRNRNSNHQPNQDYYIELMNQMSFASFVYPENKEQVLHELQQAFEPHGSARFFRS